MLEKHLIHFHGHQIVEFQSVVTVFLQKADIKRTSEHVLAEREKINSVISEW